MSRLSDDTIQHLRSEAHHHAVQHEKPNHPIRMLCGEVLALLDEREELRVALCALRRAVLKFGDWDSGTRVGDALWKADRALDGSTAIAEETK